MKNTTLILSVDFNDHTICIHVNSDSTTTTLYMHIITYHKTMWILSLWNDCQNHCIPLNSQQIVHMVRWNNYHKPVYTTTNSTSCTYIDTINLIIQKILFWYDEHYRSWLSEFCKWWYLSEIVYTIYTALWSNKMMFEFEFVWIWIWI